MHDRLHALVKRMYVQGFWLLKGHQITEDGSQILRDPPFLQLSITMHRLFVLVQERFRNDSEGLSQDSDRAQPGLIAGHRQVQCPAGQTRHGSAATCPGSQDLAPPTSCSQGRRPVPAPVRVPGSAGL